MAWSFRAAGTAATGNNAASLAPALPTGWQAGDLLILQFQNFGGTNSRTPVLPSGWTAFTGDAVWVNGTADHMFAWRTATAGMTAPTITLTGTGANGDTQLARIFAFVSSVGSFAVDQVGAESTNASADNIGPITGVTPALGALELITCGKTNDFNGAAALTGWTTAATTSSTTGSDAGMALLYILSGDGNATGNLTVTDNGATASAGLGFGQIVSFKEAAATNVATLTGTPTATGFAPTVTATSNQVASSGVGLGTIAGFAASIFLPVAVASGVGIGTVTGFAPTVVASSNVTVSTELGQVTAAGFAPSVVTPVTISTDTGSGTATGYAVTVGTPVAIPTGTGEASVVGYAPDTASPNTVATGTGESTAVGLDPTIVTPVSVQAQAGQALFTGLEPNASTPVSVPVDVGNAYALGYAPNLSIAIVVSPDAGQPTADGYGPDVKTPVNAVTFVGDLDISAHAPTVQTTANVVIACLTGDVFFFGYDVILPGSADLFIQIVRRRRR